jgi:hypothetical protein
MISTPCNACAGVSDVVMKGCGRACLHDDAVGRLLGKARHWQEEEASASYTSNTASHKKRSKTRAPAIAAFFWAAPRTRLMTSRRAAGGSRVTRCENSTSVATVNIPIAPRRPNACRHATSAASLASCMMTTHALPTFTRVNNQDMLRHMSHAPRHQGCPAAAA